MLDFTHCTPTEAVFGRGCEKQAGALLKAHGGTKALLHYGGGSIKHSGLYDRVAASLQEAGVPFVELSGVQPNPRLSLVREGIALCRAEGVDCILAVGGGSVIDSAKAIALGTIDEGDVWDFFEGKRQPTRVLPLGVVLTLPAAGSEGSNSAVITKEEGLLKRGLSTQLNRPAFAIYNPELTFTLPPYQTAYGVVDIMAHIMERYFTNTHGVEFTDQLCEATLRTIVLMARRVLADPTDYDARADIMWASTIAHNNLLGLGREQDWGSHRIEHELSGLYDVAHGAGLAVTFPAWMRFVYQHDIQRFCRFATQVFAVPMDFFKPERTALAGIEALTAFFREIGMPVTLGELGVPTDKLDEMTQKVKLNGPDKPYTGAFVPLGHKEIRAIYELMK